MQWRDFDCPICGGKQTLKERFYFNSHGDGMVYWKCERCGAESNSFESSFIDIAEMLVSVQPSEEDQMKVDTSKMDGAVRRAIFVCEAARLHAILLGCPVVPRPWKEREEEFRLQLIKLIDDLIAGRRKFPDAKTAHDSWMRKYTEMGWRYGEVYDPERKTHPDLVPYEELDPKERVKDDVFLALVNIAKEYIW